MKADGQVECPILIVSTLCYRHRRGNCYDSNPDININSYRPNFMPIPAMVRFKFKWTISVTNKLNYTNVKCSNDSRWLKLWGTQQNWSLRPYIYQHPIAFVFEHIYYSRSLNLLVLWLIPLKNAVKNMQQFRNRLKRVYFQTLHYSLGRNFAANSLKSRSLNSQREFHSPFNKVCIS